MESAHVYIGIIIALIAAAMIFIEKRPLSQVALAVAFMVVSWVVYWLLYQATPPATGTLG